jgi:Icc protein
MSTRILHLTDPHLHADPDFIHMGVNTRQSLLDVLGHVRGGEHQPDLVLITGDLTHDETAAGYQQLKSTLDTIDAPVYVLPGNHDDPALIADYLCSAQISNQAYIVLDKWQIIMLDSSIRGSECGELNNLQMDLLQRYLDSRPDLYTLICMHHQPIAVGSQWLDTMQIKNSEEFIQTIAPYPQVKAVLWGHIHQAFKRQLGAVLWLASPATCRQFLPDSQEFAIDEIKGAGYRWLLLSDTKALETHVVWL